jgi:hypothetical protein
MKTSKEYKSLQMLQATWNKPAVKVHGEDVVRFSARVDQFFKEQLFEFDAPRCSTNKELESHMYYQVPDFRSISNNGVVNEDYKIYYQVK